MNLDDVPLSFFEVDCDGSACGSRCGRHIHPPQQIALPAFNSRTEIAALGRVTVRDGRRAGYGPAEGITRLLMLEDEDA